MMDYPRESPFPSELRNPAMTPEREDRLRRAVRHVIQSSRSEDQRADVERVFDLLAFLSPEVRVLVEDETAITLGELFGSI